MVKPITPRDAVDSVVLQNISINYDPVWNGVAWVLTPTEIKVFGKGMLTEAEIRLDLDAARGEEWRVVRGQRR